MDPTGHLSFTILRRGCRNPTQSLASTQRRASLFRRGSQCSVCRKAQQNPKHNQLLRLLLLLVIARGPLPQDLVRANGERDPDVERILHAVARNLQSRHANKQQLVSQADRRTRRHTDAAPRTRLHMPSCFLACHRSSSPGGATSGNSGSAQQRRPWLARCKRDTCTT